MNFESFGKAKWKEQNVERELFDEQKYQKWLQGKGNLQDFVHSSKQFIQQVNKYINDPFTFVSFTNKPIISTNYNTYFGDPTFETPPGYYAYPIAEFVKSTAPFAKDRPFAVLLKSDPERTLVFSAYTEDQLKEDLKKLEDKFGRIKVISDRDIGQIPVNKLWNYIFSLKDKNKSYFNTAFVYLGYNTIFDDGFGIIHENEPRQAIFLTPKTSSEIIGVFNTISNVPITVKVKQNLSNYIVDGFNADAAKKVLRLLNDQSPESFHDFFDTIDDSYTGAIFAQYPYASFFLAQSLRSKPALVRKIKIQLASYSKTSSDILLQLANDKDKDVRIDVANNFNTPPEILAQLANDEDYHVRWSVTNNPNTQPEVLAQLANNKNYNVRWSVAKNPNAPPEILAQLANDEDKYVRMDVAKNPNTPPEALAQLANDKDKYVRKIVTKNPNTPLEVLAQLANDKSKDVCWGVAENPNTPSEVLAQLANNKNYHVRWSVADNLNTPPEALTQLANDEDLEIRWSVAKNPNTTSEILAQLANDEDKDVRMNVAENPNTPSEVLVQLANDEDYRVRWSVTKNPNIPSEILAQLANDEHRDVRWSIAANPNTPPEILAQLANDEDKNVLEAVQKQLNTTKPSTDPPSYTEQPSYVDPLDNQENFWLEQHYKTLYHGYDISTSIKDNVILSTRPNLNEEIIEKLLRLNNDVINENLIKNPSVSEEIKEKLMKERAVDKYQDYDDIYRAASIFFICANRSAKVALAVNHHDVLEWI